MKILTKLKYVALSSALLLGAATIANCDKVPPGPVAQMTFVVKDDFGKPVEGAEVVLKSFSHTRGNPWTDGQPQFNYYKAKTDKEGRTVIAGSGRYHDFQYFIPGNKNYHHYGSVRPGYLFKKRNSGRWEPWNPTVEIIYKPIINPVPYIGNLLYDSRKIPEIGKSFGFDMFKNDWVAPHGKGEQIDIVFSMEEKTPYTRDAKKYDYRLKITFPLKGDGIQSCFAPADDIPMRMPRYAPTEGYADNLELRSGLGENGYFQNQYRDDQNYFFRIRTESDEKGKIKSAIYGKIRGNIKFGRSRTISWNYELNPSPLDVNMEFDEKKNLLPDPR